MVKNLPANAGVTGDTGSIPGSGRSPAEGNGNPLQYSGPENSMDRGAWQTIVHGVIEADTTERITPTDIQNSTPGKRRKTWCWHSHYLASQ